MRAGWGVAAVAVIAFVACKSNSITQNNNTNNYVTQTIDKTGGTIRHPSGLATVVPENALKQATALTIGTQGDGAYPQLPGQTSAQGPVFTLMPHGQTFDQKITIYMPMPSGNATFETYVAKTDSGPWGPVAYPDANVNMTDSFDGAARISIAAQHFSYYALLSSSAAPADLTGTWNGHVTIVTDSQCVPTSDFPATLTIQATGTSFTGQISNPSMNDGGAPTVSPIDGTISGDTVTINVTDVKCDTASGTSKFIFGPCSVANNTIQCATFGGHTCIPCNGQHPADTVKSANATFTKQ